MSFHTRQRGRSLRFTTWFAVGLIGSPNAGSRHSPTKLPSGAMINESEASGMCIGRMRRKGTLGGVVMSPQTRMSPPRRSSQKTSNERWNSVPSSATPSKVARQSCSERVRSISEASASYVHARKRLRYSARIKRFSSASIFCRRTAAVTGPPPKDSELKTRVTGGSRSPLGYPTSCCTTVNDSDREKAGERK